jgi:hypothetical protein
MSDTTTTNPTTGRPPMTPLRKTALIAGVFYIMTFIFSIPVKFGFWKPVLDKPDFILGAGSDKGIAIGAMFEIITALTGIGTAVALYSVARKHSERAALGFVTSRVIEATMIFVGVLAIMSVLTLRNDVAGTAGADDGSLLTIGRTLLAVHDWTFLIGPGLMAAVNGLCLGTVMYRSRLVPRIIPTIGLIGAPLLLISDIATLFGKWDQLDPKAAAFALPIAAWEFSLGIWMTFKGFQSPDTVAAEVAHTTPTFATAAA